MVQGKTSAAQEALDQAVGISFGIRDSAAYATVKAQLLLAEGSSEEAERLLQAAMSMPGVKRQLTSQPRFAFVPLWQQVIRRHPNADGPTCTACLLYTLTIRILSILRNGPHNQLLTLHAVMPRSFRRNM